jgi:hypothetical protein
MREVEKKAKHIVEMGEHKLEKYLEEHVVPIIVGPHGEPYMIDHHHFVRACWEAGVKKVVTEVKADLSHLGIDHYWKEMVHAKWTYLLDHFGNGPHDPRWLPADVRSLADDPYRSLAWEVKAQGGFEKSETPFCEFRWAEHFRKRIDHAHDKHQYKHALEKAIKMAFSVECAHLPGYIKKAD